MKRAKRLTGLAVVAMATGCLAGEGLPQAEVILGETRVKLTLEDNPTARAFLEEGSYRWNCGMFLFQVRALEAEMARQCPELATMLRQVSDLEQSGTLAGTLPSLFGRQQKRSIDYAVMEKTDRAWVYPATFKWADIGNWEALYSHYDGKDNHGNAFVSGEKLSDGNSDLLVYSKNKGKLMAIKGLHNYMVIDTDDVLLVCPKDNREFKDFIAGIAMPDYEDFR